jgi:uncharacterized protein (UPF0335 family)
MNLSLLNINFCFRFQLKKSDVSKKNKWYRSYEFEIYKLNKDNKEIKEEFKEIYNQFVFPKIKETRNPIYVFYKNENEIKLNDWNKIESSTIDQQAKKILRDAKSFFFEFK